MSLKLYLAKVSNWRYSLQHRGFYKYLGGRLHFFQGSYGSRKTWKVMEFQYSKIQEILEILENQF
jgi:hypothetical protein